MEQHEIKVILKGLQDIHAEAMTGREFGTGICAALDSRCMSVEALKICTWLYSKFKSWPKFSGEVTYPIKGGYELYLKAAQNDEMLSRTTRYGRLRWNLLNYLIREAKKDLEVR